MGRRGVWCGAEDERQSGIPAARPRRAGRPLRTGAPADRSRRRGPRTGGAVAGVPLLHVASGPPSWRPVATGHPHQCVARPAPQGQPRANRGLTRRRGGLLAVPHAGRRGPVPLLGHAAPGLPRWLLRGGHPHRAPAVAGPLSRPAAAALHGGVPDEADRPVARAAARHGAVTASSRPQAVRAGALGLRDRVGRDERNGGATEDAPWTG